MSYACAELSELGVEGSNGLSLLVVLIYLIHGKSVQPLQHVWELPRQYICLSKIKAVLVPWQLAGGCFSSAWGTEHCERFLWQGLSALLPAPMSVRKGLCGEGRGLCGEVRKDSLESLWSFLSISVVLFRLRQGPRHLITRSISGRVFCANCHAVYCQRDAEFITSCTLKLAEGDRVYDLISSKCLFLWEQVECYYHLFKGGVTVFYQNSTNCISEKC